MCMAFVFLLVLSMLSTKPVFIMYYQNVEQNGLQTESSPLAEEAIQNRGAIQVIRTHLYG